MGQKRSRKHTTSPDEKEFDKDDQQAPDRTLEWMVYLFGPDPWLEISYFIQMQDRDPERGPDRG